MDEVGDLTFGVIPDDGPGEPAAPLEAEGDDYDGIPPVEAEDDSGAGEGDDEDDPSVDHTIEGDSE